MMEGYAVIINGFRILVRWTLVSTSPVEVFAVVLYFDKNFCINLSIYFKALIHTDVVLYISLSILVFFLPDARADGSRIPNPFTPATDTEAALQSGLFQLISSGASLVLRVGSLKLTRILYIVIRMVFYTNIWLWQQNCGRLHLDHVVVWSALLTLYWLNTEIEKSERYFWFRSSWECSCIRLVCGLFLFRRGASCFPWTHAAPPLLNL